MAEFRQALALKPDFAEAHNNLGSSLGALGEFGQAIDQYRQAIRIKPDYANARGNLDHALAASCAKEMEHYRKAVAAAPHSAEAPQ